MRQLCVLLLAVSALFVAPDARASQCFICSPQCVIAELGVEGFTQCDAIPGACRLSGEPCVGTDEPPCPEVCNDGLLVPHEPRWRLASVSVSNGADPSPRRQLAAAISAAGSAAADQRFP